MIAKLQETRVTDGSFWEEQGRGRTEVRLGWVGTEKKEKEKNSHKRAGYAGSEETKSYDLEGAGAVWCSMHGA